MNTARIVACAVAAATLVLTPGAPQAQRRGTPPPVQGGLPALQTRVQALEQQVADLSAALSAMSTQVGTLSGDLQTHITDVSVRLAGFGQLLDQFNQALNDGSGDISDLQEQVAGLEEQLAELSGGAGTLSLGDLAGSACTTPAGQEGSIEITQSKSGVAVLRCRVGTGRFIANGDETITDTQSGLMWETKVAGNNCLRCVNDAYTWDGAKGAWLDRLHGRLIASENEGGFAGYSDWRLPTLAELRTIVNTSVVPTIDPIFGPTFLSFYWSASTYASNPAFQAWSVNFSFGYVSVDSKSLNFRVRAVRGGP